METKRFYPMLDKLFWGIALPTAGLMLAVTVVNGILEPSTLFLMIPIDLLVAYFLISPLFGYVELREDTIFIKFGFFLKKEIRYAHIRGTKKERKWYSDSMMSLKNAMEHVNIRYNAFDVTTVSVKEKDDLIRELESRCQ